MNTAQMAVAAVTSLGVSLGTFQLLGKRWRRPDRVAERARVARVMEEEGNRS